MDVPLPLIPTLRPAPSFRLEAPDLDAPPTPEKFEQAVSLCAGALKDWTDPVWVSGLTSLAAGRAALLAAEGPVWCTYRCDEEGRTPLDVDVLAALIVMEGMGCAAFGLEGEDPEALAGQYRRLAPYATVPLVWPGELPRPALALELGSALTDPDVIPCASGTEARFITPDVDVGEEIRCGPELVENILEAEEQRPQGALKISVLDEDDLWAFAEAQYAIRDALCLWSDVPELLERALRCYQGRAFWDGTGDLDPEFLERMARTYGFILL